MATIARPDEVARRTLLAPGDPVPWFRAPSNVNPGFVFDTAAGRYLVLSFLGPVDAPAAAAQHAAFVERGAVFHDADRYFFGVVLGAPRPDGPFAGKRRGMDTFWDADGAISRSYGALPAEPDPAGDTSFRGFAPLTYVLGPDLRVLAVVRDPDGTAHAAKVERFLRNLPAIGPQQPGTPAAPVLYLPNVFERSLCERLIEGYERNGGTESGFMRERDGKTVLVIDHTHKRRADWVVDDEELKGLTRARIRRRVVPEIQRAFQFRVTRMERYLVACYDAETGGYFRAHRDNTTKATEHRRFAVTVNLNTEDYEGGGLMFPEYGRTVYRVPTGGAVVFSCGLLHQALPVTKGRRYTFLPFLYDDEAARIREANNAYLGEGVAPYRAGPSAG